MNKLIIFISVFYLLNYGIQQPNKDYKNIMIGNWCTCHDDGTYSEFYINDSVIELTYDDFYPLPPLIYHINNDSIFLHINLKDSIDYLISKIEIQNFDTIILYAEYDSIKKNVSQRILTRIKEEINFSPGFNSLKKQLKWYKKNFDPYYNKRWKEKKCIDIRTEEEKEIERQKVHEIQLDSNFFNTPKNKSKTN